MAMSPQVHGLSDSKHNMKTEDYKVKVETLQADIGKKGNTYKWQQTMNRMETAKTWGIICLIITL